MLITPDDPPPVHIFNPAGRASFLLLGDHAGNTVPRGLGQLGLGDEQLARHIAWDIGVAALGEALATALDAVFIRQRYSRLVIDCNRDPHSPQAMAEVSDGTAIPGNRGLTPAGRAARIAEVHAPYHAAIAAELERRDRAGHESVIVSLHSFTPVMGRDARPWQIGILHDGGDACFALSCLRSLESQRDLIIGNNQPYRMDATDYTVPRHAYAARRPYVEIEMRQDLMGSAQGQGVCLAAVRGALEESWPPSHPLGG